jgi:hypothetical protein
MFQQESTPRHAQSAHTVLVSARFQVFSSLLHTVVDTHFPGAHVLSLLIARLIAAVSSVLPSPLAPKSFTLRKTWNPEGSGLNAARPWCLIFSSQ